jgi:hypothetical protein
MQSPTFSNNPFGEPYRQAVLSACQRAHTSSDFCREFVAEVARCSDSGFCLWLNKRGAVLEVLSATPEADCLLDAARCLCDDIPLVDNAVRGIPEIGSVAIAPVRCRNQIAGVLIVGNRGSGYSDVDTRAMESVGSAAVVHYEWLRCAEAFGAPLPQPASAASMQELVHGLRQPLSVIEASTYYVDLILPDNEQAIRLEIERIREQIEMASRVLTQASHREIPVRRMQFNAAGATVAAGPLSPPSRGC